MPVWISGRHDWRTGADSPRAARHQCHLAAKMQIAKEFKIIKSPMQYGTLLPLGHL